MGADGQEPIKDFFISYTGHDVAWAVWLDFVLRAEGYSTVTQVLDFHPGGNFIAEMHKALDGCRRTIAVLSEAYLKSGYCTDEWTNAFAARGLVPVRIEDVHPTGLLRTLVFIELADADRCEAKRRLLDGLFPPDRPTTEPAFPGKPETAALGPEPRFPGALPAVWWRMPQRNRHFSGREDLIVALRRTLAGGQATALTQNAAVHGLGGIGKSELAIEYAYRFHTDYDRVAWLRAETPATLAADFAALAQPLALPERDHPGQAVVSAAVRRWCERHDRWLLIFDNAEQAQDLAEFLPRGGGG